MHSWRHIWPVEMLCRVMQLSTRGYRSWRARPMGQRARGDMKVLAHIREHYGLSLGSYGRPRMTMELKEAGLDVGERGVGRLMRINGSAGGDSAGGTIQSRTRFVPASTRSRPTATMGWALRRACWMATLQPTHPTANGRAISAMSGPQRGGSILP